MRRAVRKIRRSLRLSKIDDQAPRAVAKDKYRRVVLVDEVSLITGKFQWVNGSRTNYA